MPATEELILVDERNRCIGRGEKRAVHEAGGLHRAFSIFLVDAEGRLLLQQRHPAKYHSGGLWANACCGHPRPGERTAHAAQRRLREELGANAALRFGFRARYRAQVSGGMIENEIVYVYFGRVPEKLSPHRAEIAALRRVNLSELEALVRREPQRYGVWLRSYLEEHRQEIARGIKEMLEAHGGSGRAAPRGADLREGAGV